MELQQVQDTTKGQPRSRNQFPLWTTFSSKSFPLTSLYHSLKVFIVCSPFLSFDDTIITHSYSLSIPCSILPRLLHSHFTRACGKSTKSGINFYRKSTSARRISVCYSSNLNTSYNYVTKSYKRLSESSYHRKKPLLGRK